MLRQGLLLFLLTTASCSYAQSANQPTEKLAAMVLPKTVTVTVKASDGTILSSGSGFVVAKNRIATNLHVLTDALETQGAIVTVRFSDGRVKVVSGASDVDAQSDIALLVADTGKTPGMVLGGMAKIGQAVMAVGSPRGLSGTVSTGIVSARRQYNGVEILQITTPISHGSSGGVLVDLKGNVLGITSLSLEDGQNLNFAYPVSRINQLVKKNSYVSMQWPLLARKLGVKDLSLATTGHADSEDKQPAKEVPNNITFEQAYKKGEKLLIAKKYAEAEKYLRYAVTLNALSADAHQELSNCLHNLGKDQEANAEWAEMAKIRGDYDSYYSLGIAYNDTQDYANAIIAYKKSLYLIAERNEKEWIDKLHRLKTEFETRWFLAKTLENNKDYDLSLEQYAQACEMIEAISDAVPEHAKKVGKDENLVRKVMGEVAGLAVTEYVTAVLANRGTKNSAYLDKALSASLRSVSMNSENYRLRLVYGLALYVNNSKAGAINQWKIVAQCPDKELADKALEFLAEYSSKE